MFGNKLKIWMENYIVRSRKKDVHKEKFKADNNRVGMVIESSESLAHSDTGISSSSQQVLSSSIPDNREGYSTTTMESERSGSTHCRTAISLPSPESAYSTGYSTDGTSPGATGPPEYYINIRTGKHYFPSPTPTPTSPQPNTTFLQLHSMNQCLTSTLLPEASCLTSNLACSSRAVPSRIRSSNQMPSKLSCGFPSHLDTFVSHIQDPSRKQNIFSALTVPGQLEHISLIKSSCKKSSAKSQLASLKLFLKSPKRDKGKLKTELNSTSTFENKKRLTSNAKSKKWFKQPFQKFGHRRTDSCCEGMMQDDIKREIYFEKNFSHLFSQENSTSPRQRNRIKTNPWLPTEPMSSQNFQNLQLDFSPSLIRNRSCSNTPLQNRKENQVEPYQENPIQQPSIKREEQKNYAKHLEDGINRHMTGILTESNDYSDDDLTLNEMMGTYNESYVYEKETDILSDSDPTDCEDYESDSEADNGGDELDFIDNESVTESGDSSPRNTGKCTYYDIHLRKNSFLRKTERLQFKKSSERRKNSKKDQDSKIKRERRKQMRKSFKREDEEKKRVSEDKARPKMEVEKEKSLDFNRILMQRLSGKNLSKSVEGTPLSARKKQGMARGFTETHNGNEKVKLGETRKPFLILGDTEADNKYKELIKEAESIFETFNNSPLINKRLDSDLINDKKKMVHRYDPIIEPVSTLRKAETAGCTKREEPSKPETPATKNPKNMGLKLSVETPNKLQRLHFQTNKQNSLKSMSSTHSPLDPLGPALRIFAVFKPALCDERKISTSSSSEDSENRKDFESKEREKKGIAFSNSSIVPIAFQSVDLGKPLTSYCPQSEPVKRKIYSCSKTYDKLVKQFKNKPTIFEESIDGGFESVFFAMNTGSSTSDKKLDYCLNGNQGPALKCQEKNWEKET